LARTLPAAFLCPDDMDDSDWLQGTGLQFQFPVPVDSTGTENWIS
jgi:hypothetical protein